MHIQDDSSNRYYRFDELPRPVELREKWYANPMFPDSQQNFEDDCMADIREANKNLTHDLTVFAQEQNLERLHPTEYILQPDLPLHNLIGSEVGWQFQLASVFVGVFTTMLYYGLLAPLLHTA